MSWRPFLLAVAAVVVLVAAIGGARPEGDDALLPIAEIIARVQERYFGEVVDAEILAAKPHEEAEIVYEIRLLTPRGNVLRIRMDAVNGDFLGIDGRGLVEARRPLSDASAAEPRDGKDD